MTRSKPREDFAQPDSSLRFRIWHLCVLTVLVAIAIVNIQDQRVHEPTLIALAIGGFVLYAVLGWGAWRLARRWRSRIGTTTLASLYCTAMAGVFLASTYCYLMIEKTYLGR
jgi:predicted lysophospholipase L1 biosynthesis ABC-type transport system permease subunit